MAPDDGPRRPGEPGGRRPPEASESPPPTDRFSDGREREAISGEGEGMEAAELADAERAVEKALSEPPPPIPESRGDLEAERDDYRDALLRIKADFDNYKKRVAKDHAATVERAAERLIVDLLPVLDACEAAIGHGAADVEPIHKSLLDVLEKGGLARMSPEGQPFDPTQHEAVMHEPGDGESPETVVVGILRTGYLWNGRVVRPAMVKVRG